MTNWSDIENSKWKCNRRILFAPKMELSLCDCYDVETERKRNWRNSWRKRWLPSKCEQKTWNWEKQHRYGLHQLHSARVTLKTTKQAAECGSGAKRRFRKSQAFAVLLLSPVFIGSYQGTIQHQKVGFTTPRWIETGWSTYTLYTSCIMTTATNNASADEGHTMTTPFSTSDETPKALSNRQGNSTSISGRRLVVSTPNQWDGHFDITGSAVSLRILST